MNVNRLFLSAGVLALGVASLTVATKAQGPLYDRVDVNFPYTISIGEKVLPPGDYVIRQLPSPGGASRVLLIYSNNGMRFETSAMTIPTLNNRTPEDTKVVLHHFGNDYYFDKIWIQGKDYGYEFVLPDSVKARERERLQPINVAASYQSTSDMSNTTTAAANATTTDNDSTTTSTETTTANQTTTQAQSDTTTSNATTMPATTTGNDTVAQSDTTTTTATENQTTANNYNAAPADTTTSGDMTSGAANRSMPSTSANWLMMLLSGGMLSGAGLALRRIRG